MQEVDVASQPGSRIWSDGQQQMYHVKEYPYPVPGNLDLNIADEEEFSPDKLRATIERLYMTVGIGMVSGPFSSLTRQVLTVS